MRAIPFLMVCLTITIVFGCNLPDPAASIPPYTDDSMVLTNMIAERERAMIARNIEGALEQFSDDATWINSQGYYFEGKDAVAKFHGMLAGNDSLDYFYEAGEPKVRLLDSTNAIAYYGWKMFWYRKDDHADTTNREIGLMTLNAQKHDDEWKWVAVTNQHTPLFYRKITPVYIDE